jgi:hypothetical protein
MRALGPGSVSSILKVILDVVYYACWVIGVVAAVLAGFALFATLQPQLAPPTSSLAGGSARDAAFQLACGALYILGTIVIVGRLRALFASLTAGDPFHPDNVIHLRVIALTLAALEVGQYGAAAVAAVTHLHPARSWGFNPTLWFAVLVISVLAEVFREGARLRREAELTI